MGKKSSTEFSKSNSVEARDIMSWNGCDLWEFGYSTVERVTRNTSVNYSFTEVHSSRAITFLNYRLS